MYVYMRVTKDAFERPIAIADTESELARMLGMYKQNVHNAIKNKRQGWAKVWIEEEEND